MGSQIPICCQGLVTWTRNSPNAVPHDFLLWNFHNALYGFTGPMASVEEFKHWITATVLTTEMG
jgi:hypothetical protein